MSDPRLTPDPSIMSGRNPMRVVRPVVDLCRTPDGTRDRQVLYGETLDVLATNDNWSYVQTHKDGYCGYVPSDALDIPQTATHKVTAPATHAYKTADFKSPDLTNLSHGSQITVVGNVGKFAQTLSGYIPLVHLSPIAKIHDDPAKIAALYLGTPYLWGGNSRWGIDCSGLVQAALLNCGIPCPGDSDMQQTLGTAATTPYKRNDLLFWKGHVALVTDGTTLIHANAGSMATVFEPIQSAIDRITTQGDGPVTAHRRF